MKNLNRKLLNCALWAELALSYFLPFHTADGSRYTVGFPLPFLTVYPAEIGISPLMSTYLNPLTLLANVFLLYFVLLACQKAVGMLRRRKGNASAQN